MVTRIIWTIQADYIFTKILEFYIERNGSKTYSRILNDRIQSLVKIISKQPFIGSKTNFEDIRVFTQSDYKIFYQIDNHYIIIHLIWDCRQNPESLKLRNHERFV
jgi:toxin YoeB